MKKTVLTFGLISGGLSAVLLFATTAISDRLGFDKGEILGYTLIVLSALLIFFGVRSYRENASGGRLTFARAFAVGILISLISSFCYVASWEIAYFKFMPDFTDKYAAYSIEKAKASGASQEKIKKKIQEAQHFKEIYKNPAVNVAMTFMEVFPIWLGRDIALGCNLEKEDSERRDGGSFVMIDPLLIAGF